MRFPKLNTKTRWTGLCLAGLSLVGCRLDMHDAPRYDPMEESPLFANGASARPLVEGTIARGEYHPDQEDKYSGWAADGGFVQELPEGMALTESLLRRGQERFNIYCTPCHGYTGAGDGMIVQRGFRPPPTFHNARNREEGLGRIYFVLSNGYGQMYSYAHALKPEDRWAVAAYIRVLQLSQNAPLAAVPADIQARLKERTQ